ncbi:MAG: Ig-like domain-containing protein [Vibrio sp.]
MVVEITVTPSPISVLKGRTQQLVAMAKFDDGTESDVSGSATWAIVGDPTIAKVSASGLVTGNTIGGTELTASKDGITSDVVSVNVCNLAGPCLDIFDTGGGKLFTNSPSVAYLDSIGGSATSNIYGDFYRFTLDYANTLCDTYNTLSLGGRTNWSLATRDELLTELYGAFGDMFSARGWSTSIPYKSVTSPNNGSSYFYINLGTGWIAHNGPENSHYASCVSNP